MTAQPVREKVEHDERWEWCQRGDGPDAGSLKVRPTNFHLFRSYLKSDEDLQRTIECGIVFAPMHAWQGELTENEIQDVLGYVRLLSQQGRSGRLWFRAVNPSLILDSDARTEPKPGSWQREPLISPDSPEPRTCWPAVSTGFRSTARWPTPTSRRTRTRSRHSSILPILNPITSCSSSIPTIPEGAARKVVALAPKLISRGITVRGVRLDSGDLADHARRVRRILDHGGLTQVQILASGNLDEYRVQQLTVAEAPIDSFAVGTAAMTTSGDAPALDCACSFRNTIVVRLASVLRERPPGPVANRFIGIEDRRDIWRTISSRSL